MGASWELEECSYVPSCSYTVVVDPYFLDLEEIIARSYLQGEMLRTVA